MQAGSVPDADTAETRERLLFRCPSCSHPLHAHTSAYGCDNGHSFDRSREGYVNLLPTKARKNLPGDAPEMVQARRAFLDAGHYEPLRAALLDLVPSGSVLDVGCGEGYYTRPLGEQEQDQADRRWIGGIDLSKAAVRLAARRNHHIHYAVGNAFDLPVVSGSIDAAINVFSPIAPSELARVTTADGVVITVVPAPRHLGELKRELFDTPTEHLERGPLDNEGSVRHLATVSVTFEMELGRGEAGALVAMTPYQWQLTSSGRDRLRMLEDGLAVTADFRLDTYRLSA